MQQPPKLTHGLRFGLLLISLSTLLLQLTLIRVFDIVLTPNYAYMVVSSAIFAYGLAGIWLSIAPMKNPSAKLQRCALLCALSVAAVILVLNHVPFDFTKIDDDPVRQLFFVTILYVSLIVPFFLSGLIISGLFTEFHQHAQQLYFFDLGGAALGCLLVVPILPGYGPAGIFLVVAALYLFTTILLRKSRLWYAALVVGAVGFLVAYPPLRGEYLEIKGHTSKRGVIEAKQQGFIEYTRWDPVSKIEVVGGPQPNPNSKHIAYDGGNQSSYFFGFDGDFEALRERIDAGPGNLEFWGRKVLVSHYLKQGTEADVLVLGSAGGQEVKAALTYDAGSVTGVELVKTVVDLGLNGYGDYIGGIFRDPRVSVLHGEGRSFLRSSGRTFDVIQIFSNHTSSSIANGYGAMSPVYLQTVEAYVEYFEHLATDGILHINHHYYPRMLTTAAHAWERMGRTEFGAHTLVLEVAEGRYSGSLPTMLIKMSPWTRDEVARVLEFLEEGYQIVFHPIDRQGNLIPTDQILDAESSLYTDSEHRLYPSTDDRPYFGFVRKTLRPLDHSRSPFLDWGTASLQNSQLRGPIPMDLIHLVVVGLIALVFAAASILIPLRFSEAGRASWDGKAFTLLYFSCLGAGFIILELTLIQIFIKLIGYPVYTYSTVVFSLLAAAGCGSFIAGKSGPARGRRWILPFVAIIVLYTVFGLSFPFLFDLFLSSGVAVRILVSIVLLAPLGFFLGVPFPMGIALIGKRQRAAVPWAWGMNGMFTVIGGLASVLLSLFYGFRFTLFAALLLYALAFWAFSRMNRAAPAS